MLLLIRSILFFCFVVAVAPAADSETLRDIQAGLVEQYPGVHVMSPEELTREIARGGDLLILDVRSEEEFRVSHIPGALRVDPGASANKVADLISGLGNPGTIVFYCSVGNRSTRLANRVQKALLPDAEVSVFNLSGGLFLWHNQYRPLVGERGHTEYIHPNFASRAELLIRKNLVSTKPPGQADP